MRYRPLGRTGLEVSVLGFGCMRLPILGQGGAADIFEISKRIDIPAAEALVARAVEGGVNYFDTAYIYHGGQSESFLGRALAGRREKVLLATKMPTWMVRETGDFDRFLDKQLARLRTDWVDCYLIHGLSGVWWRRLRDLGAAEFLQRIKREGRARFVGFSFHDDLAAFREIVDDGGWDLCQIQLNYLDQEFQAGLAGMRYAAERGLGVVVMEPLRGGKLVERPPERVRELFAASAASRTRAAWALDWVWHHPEVATALSGMGAAAELEENLALADTAAAGALTAPELALIEEVREAYRGLQLVPCTGCAYCMPCPNGVQIPINFTLFNDAHMFGDTDLSLYQYNRSLPQEARASACIECGECVERCPQKIDIPAELRRVHESLRRGEA